AINQAGGTESFIILDEFLNFIGTRNKHVKPVILEGRREAFPVLFDLVKAEDSFVSREAIIALGILGPEAEEAIPSLTEVLRGKNSCNSEAALRSLARIGPKGWPVLCEALQDERSEIRASVANALGRYGLPPKFALPIL